jgi:hypothetical protein
LESVGAVTSTVKFPAGRNPSNIPPGAVALQTPGSDDGMFLVHIENEAIAVVERAMVQALSSPQRRAPKFSISSSADHDAILSVAVDHVHGAITFCYCDSSPVHRLGLQRLQRTVPQNPAHLVPARLRCVLDAGAHFFQYLFTAPKTHARHGIVQANGVRANLCELAQTDDFRILGGRISRVLQIKRRLDIDIGLGGYRVNAPMAGSTYAQTTPYGVEVVNHLEHELYAWVFFFDCSTFSIRKSCSIYCKFALTSSCAILKAHIITPA